MLGQRREAFLTATATLLVRLMEVILLLLVVEEAGHQHVLHP